MSRRSGKSGSPRLSSSLSGLTPSRGKNILLRSVLTRSQVLSSSSLESYENSGTFNFSSNSSLMDTTLKNKAKALAQFQALSQVSFIQLGNPSPNHNTVARVSGNAPNGSEEIHHGKRTRCFASENLYRSPRRI